MNDIGIRALAGLFAVFLSVALFGATEIPVVSDVDLHDPPESRYAVALASDGDSYLAVWTDTRAGGRAALLATRIRSTGESLDPTGIFIAPYEAHSTIVWNGERYLIFFVGGHALQMASIDRDGVLSGPVTLIERVGQAAAATNGSRILVAYTGDAIASGRSGAHVATLDMDGGVVLDMEVDVHRTYGSSVAVLANGNFAVGWNNYTGTGWSLNALRFNADGTRAEFVPRVLGDAFQPAALHANGVALVATSPGRCWGVSTDLQERSTQAQCPEGSVFSLRGRAALVSAEGERTTRLDMSVSLFDEQGHAVEQKSLFKASDQEDARVAGLAATQKGDDVLIVWSVDEQWTNNDRLFARVVRADSLEPKGERVPLAKSADGQLDPSIAVGETEMLVAWEERGEVYASRITLDGRRLDGEGILLSTDQAREPRVVFHEGRYAVAFVQPADTEYDEVVVRTISPRDGLLPEIATTSSGFIDGVALASGGGTLLAIWNDRRSLLATRIHPGGTTDPAVLLAWKEDAWPRYPVASWNGSHFLVAWRDNSSASGAWRASIPGRRVTRDLGLDGDTLALAEEAGDDGPALASKDGEWFLAWSHENQVRLARVAADGAVLSELPAPHGNAPQLAFAGQQLVVAVKEFGYVNVQAGQSFTRLPSLPYDGFSLTARAGKWYTAFARLGGKDVGHVERVYVASPGPRRRTVR